MLFSCIILFFLFLIQIVFLNAFYKNYKTSQLDKVANSIMKMEKISVDELENISYESGICISAYKENNIKVISNFYNRGCIIGDPSTKSEYIYSFASSDSDTQTYILKNKRFNNSTLVKAIKVGDYYIFLNTSLEPLDASIVLYKVQFVYIALIIFALSILISYFISREISKPIVKMSKSAHNMAKGDYSNPFETPSSISEINELSNTLENARIELSKTEELRRDLMANVGHDLKTPLTMIRAYAEMTRDMKQTSDKKNENMNIIIEETNRLTMLVNDILDLSKIQAETEELHMELYDINAEIKNIIRRFNYLVSNEKYSIIYDNDEIIMVNADKKRIEQVIYNLISNAINYTGKNKKIIIKTINSKNSVRIEITDTGKGIEKDKIKDIWNRYYHNEKKHKRNAVGTGLGLSIVKNILEKHEFKYGVDSKIGKGTTFYFIINK